MWQCFLHISWKFHLIPIKNDRETKIIIIFRMMTKNNTPLTERGPGGPQFRKWITILTFVFPYKFFLHPRMGKWLLFKRVERQLFWMTCYKDIHFLEAWGPFGPRFRWRRVNIKNHRIVEVLYCDFQLPKDSTVTWNWKHIRCLKKSMLPLPGHLRYIHSTFIFQYFKINKMEEN